ncbi:hypothetical protein [Pseudophaeobacter sp. EL27]|uniref:hypothetical protein n=1 Tax=Pseudophaeobacter sp. EL27 TaxID=2107580 RepID=UPI0020B13D31|nr:hypothetical protein [Pseudophaeobacter sp. EL27]
MSEISNAGDPLFACLGVVAVFVSASRALVADFDGKVLRAVVFLTAGLRPPVLLLLMMRLNYLILLIHHLASG